MAFKDTFCPSPWLHMRITNSGDYEFCRWAKQSFEPKENIKQIHPVVWFQENMAPLRKDMLDGKPIDKCSTCYNMESHGKVSGRQKQLLKVGITLQDFEKTMLSSPWVNEWTECQKNQGLTDLLVQDWQIDLGNFCNSACLFCRPDNSSRLASEYHRLGLISNLPPPPWCDDDASLAKFIDTLRSTSNISYIHFIGGETLITPAFKKILNQLIEMGLNKKVTIGFTTNLTVIDQDILDLLVQFHQVGLGVSIECIDPVNDYIRYGGSLAQTMRVLDRWADISRQRGWYMAIRPTPTVLSISKLHTIYEYGWQNKILVESCNFIVNPIFMRPSVLPEQYRIQARDSLQSWIDQKGQDIDGSQIVNIRNPSFLHQQLLQDASSYIKYLDNEPDLSRLLPDLVNYLKVMDGSRKNSVLDYLPEYEEFLRSAGY